MDQEKLFLEAVRNNREKMFRIAMSLLHVPADAEDAVSAAVESTWKHFHGIRNPEALSAYLVRSAVNAARDELRRRKRNVPLDSVDRTLAAEDPGDPVYWYIRGLDEKYRLPLVLRFQEQMTEQEIAAALRLPRGTVSTRIRHALAVLKEQMEKEVPCDAE